MNKGIKKILFTVMVLSMICLLPQMVSAKSVKGINYKKVFKEKGIISDCKECDTNKDGFLSKKESKDVRIIYIEKNKKNINLKGISRLKNLISLEIKTNARIYNLKEVAKLSKLQQFTIQNKKVRQIDLRKNKNLKEIHIRLKGGKVKLADNSLIGKAEFSGVNGVTLLLKKMPRLYDIKIEDDKTSKEFIKNNGGFLGEIYISNTKIRKIDISKCESLRCISIMDTNDLEECNFTDIKKLRCVVISSGENLAKFTMNNVQGQRKIEVRNNKKIKELNLGNMPELEMFKWTNGVLEKMRVENAEKLSTIDLSKNKLKSFQYPQLKNLIEIMIGDNEIQGEFNWNQHPKLRVLECRNNKLTRINGADYTGEVYMLDCYNNNLKTIDLRNSKKVYWINCEKNPGVEIFADMYSYSGDADVKIQ